MLIVPFLLAAKCDKTRSFQMGTAAIPSQPIATESWVSCFKLMQDNKFDRILHHVKKIEDCEFIAAVCKQYGFKPLFMIDPLSPDRKTKIMSWETYVKLAGEVSTKYPHLDYLGLGSEVNTYTNPNEFILEINKACDAVKASSPSINVFVSAQYEVLLREKQWSFLDKLPKMDVVGISTYPKLPLAPGYYTELLKHTKLPVIIAESGYPSDSEIGGSEQMQAKFVLEIVNFAEHKQVIMCIYWFLHDISGYPPYFSSCGLRASNGKEKLAWNAWKSNSARDFKP